MSHRLNLVVKVNMIMKRKVDIMCLLTPCTKKDASLQWHFCKKFNLIMRNIKWLTSRKAFYKLVTSLYASKNAKIKKNNQKAEELLQIRGDSRRHPQLNSTRDLGLALKLGGEREIVVKILLGKLWKC